MLQGRNLAFISGRRRVTLHATGTRVTKVRNFHHQRRRRPLVLPFSRPIARRR